MTKEKLESDWSTTTFISRQKPHPFQGKTLPSNKCTGCGCYQHNNHIWECPAQGQICRKCGRLHHYEKVCGMLPGRKRQSNNAHSSTVKELNANQHSGGPSMTSIPVAPTSSKFSNTVPKQVVDIVDIANSVDNISKSYRRQLELDTLGTSGKLKPTVTSPTQIFSNIEIDGVLVQGKQDTGAEINAMPLNVYDQLNLKLHGKLQLRPCGDIKVIGYSKQSVNIVGTIGVTCTHANVIKKCIFYVTDTIDTKVILRLNFCRAFNLATVNCNDQCVCKQITVDVINSKFP